METFKITLIAPPYRPVTPEYDDYGGIEVGVGNLAEYFDNQGHEVHLFSSFGETSWVPKYWLLWAIGYWKNYMLGQLTPESYWKMIQRQDNAMKEIKTSDVVNSNMMKHFCSEIKSKHINENYITSSHTVDPNVVNLEEGFNYRLTAPSYHLAKILNRTYDQQWMFRAIHPGPVKKERYPFKKKKGERLLYMGRIFEPKGVTRAINIAEKLKMPIDIVGRSEGDKREYVEFIEKTCKKSDYATMHGKVSFDDKVKFYQNAKCLLIPSIEYYDIHGETCKLWVEPFGNITVEAGMCGTPSIVPPSGGLCETVSDGINEYYACTDDEFVHAVEKISNIKPEDCKRRALYFDAEHGGKRYLEHYKHVLDGDEW
jgi:glycosyltransferase involved in cell wall biosynthesis